MSGPPPILSIVTPSLNQAAFLEETIHSVVSQAGDFSVDYVIVDGASTDGSVDIIRTWADRVAKRDFDRRCRGVSLRWVSERDEGQSQAINRGLRRAQGEILAYLNSDDALLPGALASVREAFAKEPEADLVHGDGEVIDERSETKWVWLSRPFDYSLLRSYHWFWNDFTNYILQQATFWRRRVHDRIGFFDESLHYSMDLEFWLRAGSAGLRFRHLPARLARFRMTKGTKSLSTPTAFWLDNMELFRRHNGARAMAPFFTFFYFNHALAGPPGAARKAEQALFSRWSGLSQGERGALERTAGEAWPRAELLLALALLDRGRRKRARAVFRRAVRRRSRLRLHPFALAFLGLKWGGPRLGSLWSRLVARYRRRRYLYRYP